MQCMGTKQLTCPRDSLSTAEVRGSRHWAGSIYSAHSTVQPALHAALVRVARRSVHAHVRALENAIAM